MNMLWKRSQFVFIASLCLLLLGLNVKASDKPGAAATRAEVVWSESEGGKSRIYYSALIGPGWTGKVALPDSAADDIIPCIARTADGVTWVVWIALGADGNSLFYVYSKGGVWSEAKEIPTGLCLSPNGAPSIAVDKEDRPVIVWAGRDDKQENHIFFSRWNGMDWEEASRVDRDDLTLCITPLIGTKPNGDLSVCWYGLDGTFYKPYCSEWYYDKSKKAWRWSDEIESDADNLFKVQIDRGKKGEIPKLPEFIPEPLTAGVYVIGEGRLKHIAMRYFLLERLIEKSSPSNRVATELAQVPAGSDILAFGDSITQGVPYVDANGEGRRWVGGYEPRLDSLLNSPVYNWGVAGEATPDGLRRLQEQVLTHPADYVLIMEGLNDRWVIPGNYEATKTNLGLMIDACRTKGVTPILATLTPDGRPDLTYQNDVTIVNNYNPRIEALASEKGVILADQHAALRPNWNFLSWSPVDGFAVDWFHPHMDGYNAMAGVWYMAITGQTMVPTVTTYSISSITATSASGGGYVTLDGGASVTARGVCWSTTANPTIANSKTTNGTGTGSFTSQITTGLTPGTTYHVRAYATNSVGTAYGNDVTFTTSATTPTVTTAAISSITATSASSGGNVTSSGGASVTARGVCWSTTANPTTANSKTTNGTGTGSFTSLITGLDPLKTYHVRAYATNSVGTAYGSDVTFETTCSGGAVVIQNKTFAGGTTTTCNCTESITIGPGVIIESNADVTFKAPVVNGVPVLTIREGAKARITQ